MLANVLNNLPATLLVVPLVAPPGPVAVLAALIGTNIGPNLTYVGSLATLLWRRVLRTEGIDVDLGEFTRLGALTVPAGLSSRPSACGARPALHRRVTRFRRGPSAPARGRLRSCRRTSGRRSRRS